MPRSSLSLIVLGIAAVPATAQDWVRLHPLTSPPGLGGHAMAYDVANDRTVLFGGATTGNVRQNFTWLFDGFDWTQATPAVSPPARAGHPLAYDLVRNRIVLFGGIGAAGVLNDTWEWDGSNWAQMTPATNPPARLSHPLVYHPGRGTCVMHGGNGVGAGTLTDTWEWNGVDWAQIPTANYPLPLRYAADMAYDPVGNGIVLFSGYPGGPADTWYFDNVNWNQLTTAHVPPGRWDHTLATDPRRNRVVLFGGTAAAAADTWEFDGTDWNQMAPATLPPGRNDDYMAYDLARGRVMMFGGGLNADTWSYATPSQPGLATAIPYGAGCLDEASASIYETFPANTFDLSNTTLQLLPATNGYVVLMLPGAPQWYTPTSPSLGLGDDVLSGPLPLGFTLNYPGGSTNDVYVSSNGFVLGQPGGANQCCTGSPALLLAGLPRWSAVWCDLNPGAGGSTHFDIDPGTFAAIVTFQNVPEYGQATTQTFQIAFFPSGIVELRFQTCGVAAHTALAGWSPGGNSRDPGPTDLSAITAPVITSPDKTALWLEAGRRPVTGSTVALRAGMVPPTAALAALIYGLTELNPGFDLTVFGMPGCLQFTSLDVQQLLVPAGGLATSNFTVPANPAFAGVAIKAQAAVLVPGYNAAGAIVSNGMRLRIDVQ